MLGAGGHATVVVDTILALGWSVVAVYDDDAALHGTTVLGAPVVGPISDARAAEIGAVVAIADNTIRRQIVERVRLPFQSIVHPAAVVARDVIIGDGTVVFAGARSNPVHVLACTASSTRVHRSTTIPALATSHMSVPVPRCAGGWRSSQRSS